MIPIDCLEWFGHFSFLQMKNSISKFFYYCIPRYITQIAAFLLSDETVLLCPLTERFFIYPDLWGGKPKDFEQIVQSKGLKATKTGFFSIRDVKEPLNKDIIEQSLYMDKGKVSAPVKSGKNYIVFRLLDKKPAYIPSFEKIKEKVIEKYKEEKSKELLKNKAMEMKKILSSRDIKNLAVKEKLKLEQTAYFSKMSGTVKITCLKNNVFSLKKKEGDFCISNGIAYIYQLKERKTLDKKEYDELKNETRKKLEQKERETAIQDFLKQLKTKAKIRINEKALS